MKTIGIKLADGTFYPVLEEGQPGKKTLDLTTVKDNQTKVLVDLYRTATGTMEDAEYVDTLQIDNLVAHPNGQVDLSFNVALDENNELSAEINDPESGGHSDTTITLVSRTLEERMAGSDFSISDTKAEKTPAEDTDSEELTGAEAGGMLAGAGLLAAAGEKAANEEKKPDAEESVNTEDFALPDFDVPSDEKTDTSSLPDFDTIDLSPAASEEKDTDSQNLTGSAETAPADDFKLPDNFAEITDTATTDTANAVAEADKTDASFEDTVTFAKNSLDETQTAEPPVADKDSEPLVEEATFDMPDFGNIDGEAKDADSQDIAPVTSGTEAATDDFSLPDFNETETVAESSETAGKNASDDFFTIGDTPEAKDSDSENLVKDNTPSSGINFSGLYDKETVQGKSSSTTTDSESLKKKTKTPVLICIICAIICVIATILVLFVVPSKYNLISSRNTAVKEEAVAEPSAPVEEAVPEPKEDEVVVAPAEEVIPEPPPAPAEKPADIDYKIKWGDTLWDIAGAYYKNPWRYHMIARYNHIKDPDYIISGTHITLPVE